MTTPTPARPQKVTMACLIAGMGSLFVLVSIFAELSSWGSLEVRQQVEEAMKSTPFSTGGVDVDQVLGWLRVVLMVMAAGGAAGVLLAVWTAKGHRGARVALSVLAGAACLSFLALGILGLLPAALAVGSIMYLWSKESRAWFAGEEPPAPSSPRAAAEAARTPETPAWPPPLPGHDADPARRPGDSPPQVVQSPEDGPRPSDRPFGTVPAESHDAPAAAQHPYAQHPSAQHPGPQPGAPARPRSIVIAVVVTSVMAGLVGLVCGANAVLYLLSPQEYTQLLLDQPMMQERHVLEDLGMSASELSRLIFVGALVCAVLAAAAIAASLLMLRRLPAARIGLTVVTGLAIALSVVAFPFGLVWAVGEVFVLVQIYRVDANAWFAHR